MTIRSASLAALLAACVPTDPPADLDGDGFTTAQGDCDDTRSDVSPDAIEHPDDGLDQDCDGLELCPADADGDGSAGQALVAAATCPDLRAGDCDDEDPARHPLASETCNGVDDDCDGLTDDDDPDRIGAPVWWVDHDNDGFGDPALTLTACGAEPWFLPAGEPDCDDLDPDTRPGAEETPADGVDEDCDGQEDCWEDADLDGFGGPTVLPSSDLSCTTAGHSPLRTDCDDLSAEIWPGAPELCGPTDRDCDGAIGDLDPDAGDASLWQRDLDEDGFGDAAVKQTACLRPTGWTSDDRDCNDDDPSVNPDAIERCNGRDDDCDDLSDDDDPSVVDAQTHYLDADGDGYGTSDSQTTCLTVSPWDADTASDCDDTLPWVSPADTEIVGNSIDEDCDGEALCWADLDGDGAAGTTTVVATTWDCSAMGEGAFPDDCDDDDPDVQRFVFFPDLDGDGHGDPAGPSFAACTAPLHHVQNDTDCDDLRFWVHPDAVELPSDGLDGDCDGNETCLLDADQDGWAGTVSVETPDLNCSGDGLAVAAGDCDDGDPGVSPGAFEAIGDGIDGDCDGTELCFLDADGDGWGSTRFIAAPVGPCIGASMSGNALDCDDDDPAIAPETAEICGGPDENCNGLEDDDDPTLEDAPTWWPDEDGDGLGDETRPTRACVAPAAHVELPGDCADTLPGWTSCPWVETAVGDTLTCGRALDGAVSCWGATAAVPDRAFVAIAVGGATACGLDDSSALTCWGDDGSGLVTGAPTGSHLDVSVGVDGACAIDPTGGITCWGEAPDPPPGAFQAVTAGDGFACALDDLGEAICWGSACDPTPPAGPWEGLDAGAQHVCGHGGGQVACWGCDTVGEVADTPAHPALQLTAVSSGGNSSCGTTPSGVPWCWGALAAPNRAGVVQLSTGTAHACAVTDDGTIACWGDPARTPVPFNGP